MFNPSLTILEQSELWCYKLIGKCNVLKGDGSCFNKSWLQSLFLPPELPLQNYIQSYQGKYSPFGSKLFFSTGTGCHYNNVKRMVDFPFTPLFCSRIPSPKKNSAKSKRLGNHHVDRKYTPRYPQQPHFLLEMFRRNQEGWNNPRYHNSQKKRPKLIAGLCRFTTTTIYL